MTRVVLLATSGPEYGIGHVRRMRLLAAELDRRDGVSASVSYLDPAAPVIPPQDLGPFDVLVIDLPPALVDDALVVKLEAIRDSGRRVVAVDDPDRGVDLLVVPSFALARGLADRLAAAGTPVVWGWDALLIPQRLAPGSTRGGVEAPVLVLTGGSDASGLGATLPALLDVALPAGTVVDWVTGPLATPPVLPGGPRCVWCEHRGLDDLRPLMAHAGAALAVYGVSVLELLHHGVPTVVLSPYGDRDATQLEVLEWEGLALTATDTVTAVRRLVELLADPVRARELGRRAAARIPAPGTARVADAVLGRTAP